MLNRFHGITKFFLAKGKTDLRMGIDGLVLKISSEFKLDPYEGAAFLFCGSKNNVLKVLIWEGDGFTLMHKRFEKGRMQWPRTNQEAQELTYEQLKWLLEGLQIEAPNPIKKVEKPTNFNDKINELLNY